MSAFDEVRWAFPTSRSLAPHDMHPYPARFIPEIPAAAIALAEGVDGAVLDPFCGAGTTLVEAIRAGRLSIGLDLNPIATLMSKVKVVRWAAGDERQLDRHALGIRHAAVRGDAQELEEARSRIPRLDHWFGPEAQHVLAGATAYLKTVDDPTWHDRLALAISASVVRISRQDSDTRYAAVQRQMDIDRAVNSLSSALAKVASQLQAFAPFHRGESAIVLTADARDIDRHVAPSSVAAAVFSPPYPNAYEYWLYHKYRMYWLGFDPLQVRSDEMGARPHYSGGGKSTMETFRSQMLPVMQGVHAALRLGGICLVVVGDSKIKGETYDGSQLFDSIADEVGLERIAHGMRELRSARKSFNLAVARATHEHVLLYLRS